MVGDFGFYASQRRTDKLVLDLQSVKPTEDGFIVLYPSFHGLHAFRKLSIRPNKSTSLDRENTEYGNGATEENQINLHNCTTSPFTINFFSQFELCNGNS
jgi:hypothetical protein